MCISQYLYRHHSRCHPPARGRAVFPVYITPPSDKLLYYRSQLEERDQTLTEVRTKFAKNRKILTSNWEQAETEVSYHYSLLFRRQAALPEIRTAFRSSVFFLKTWMTCVGCTMLSLGCAMVVVPY
jgi:hypothetical protein